MFSRSLNVYVSLCLWITALMSPASVCARKQDDSFFTASIYRARCASRCLSLHITRISAFFKHSQVRACGRSLCNFSQCVRKSQINPVLNDLMNEFVPVGPSHIRQTCLSWAHCKETAAGHKWCWSTLSVVSAVRNYHWKGNELFLNGKVSPK